MQLALRPARRADRELRRPPPRSWSATSRPTTGWSRPARPRWSAARDAGRRGRCASPSSTRRSARRCACSCARCAMVESDAGWELRSSSARRGRRRRRCGPDLRDRVRYVSPPRRPRGRAAASADIIVAASSGAEPQPGLAGPGQSPAAPCRSPQRPRVYAEVLGDGDRGLLFERRATARSPRSSRGCSSDDALRERLRAGAAPRPWLHGRRRVRGDLRGARRAPQGPLAGNPRPPPQLAGRPLIDVDLHMHTDHSHDCATPVEVLLETARDKGLGRDRHHRAQRDLRARSRPPRSRRSTASR